MKVKFVKLISKASLALVLLPTQVFAAAAASGAMPWDSSLTQFQGTLTGSTAKLVLTIAIAVSGLAFSFGEQGGFMRKAAGVVFGGSVAMGAVKLAELL